MRKRTTTLLLAFAVILSSIAGWTLRGIYDEIFLWNGHVHVISHLSGEHSVTLEFPSGEKRKMNLKEYESKDLVVPDTGEGSIAVYVEEKLIDRVGYVTSMNNPIVLCIKEDTIGFSQVFRN